MEKPGARKATYKLTTTVMLRMNVSKDEVGTSSLSGSLTRQVGLFANWWTQRPVYITAEMTHVLYLG